MKYNTDLLKSVFTNIYTHNLWGSNESRSGIGSTKKYTESIQDILCDFIKEKDIKIMIDTSCGDWNWMRHISDKLPKYTGIDIVEDIVIKNSKHFGNENVKFVNSDFISYIKNLPRKSIDLILCRHTLEHLPETYNLDFIKLAKSVCKYLMVTTHTLCNKNENLIYPNTYRPINMQLKPYNFIDNYLIDIKYDGPKERKLTEMNICVYAFGDTNENI